MDYNFLMSIIFDVKTFSPTLMWGHGCKLVQKQSLFCDSVWF